MLRWQAALRLVGVGWYVSVSILLGIFGGQWLDDKFDTDPLFVIVGLILGVVIAFYGVYRMFLPLIRNRGNKEDS